MSCRPAVGPTFGRRHRPRALPYQERLHSQAGFSLLETMVAAIILMVMLLAMIGVLAQGQDTFNTLAARAYTQMRVQGAIDEMVKEMRNGSLGNLTTGSPAQFVLAGVTYDDITLLPVVGVQSGGMVFGPAVRYRFEVDSGEDANPGVDDDGDGLVDEGNLIRSTGGSETVVCSRVKDVGFTLSNDQLHITLTASALDDDGYEHQFTGQAAVSFRNQ